MHIFTGYYTYSQHHHSVPYRNAHLLTDNSAYSNIKLTAQVSFQTLPRQSLPMSVNRFYPILMRSCAVLEQAFSIT